MGLRIELEEIWRRLQTRFKARTKTDTDPEDPDHPVLIETIQPITDIDELLKEYVSQAEAAISRLAATGVGIQAVFTVPKGKRYTIYAMDIIRTGGDGTVTIAYVQPSLTLMTQGAAGSIRIIPANIPGGIILDEDMGISMYVDAITTDTAWDVSIYRAEEDSF